MKIDEDTHQNPKGPRRDFLRPSDHHLSKRQEGERNNKYGIVPYLSDSSNYETKVNASTIVTETHSQPHTYMLKIPITSSCDRSRQGKNRFNGNQINAKYFDGRPKTLEGNQ